jgi:hypothetical protein
MNIEDWRNVSIDHVAFDPEELKQSLIPVLRNEGAALLESGREWAERRVRETQEQLSRVLPLANNEREFLEALLEKAEVRREHLTGDPGMIETISRQPMLHWKAMNVKQFNKNRRHRPALPCRCNCA